MQQWPILRGLSLAAIDGTRMCTAQVIDLRPKVIKDITSLILPACRLPRVIPIVLDMLIDLGQRQAFRGGPRSYAHRACRPTSLHGMLQLSEGNVTQTHMGFLTGPSSRATLRCRPVSTASQIQRRERTAGRRVPEHIATS
jgi:hypothetical protein